VNGTPTVLVDGKSIALTDDALRASTS
jgi:hypothetical protein